MTDAQRRQWLAVMDIITERDRQDEKFGIQQHSDFEWSAILAEEVGEAAHEAIELDRAAYRGLHLPSVQQEVKEWRKRLRTELIQVAAVALAWVEELGRRSAKEK